MLGIQRSYSQVCFQFDAHLIIIIIYSMRSRGHLDQRSPYNQAGRPQQTDSQHDSQDINGSSYQQSRDGRPSPSQSHSQNQASKSQSAVSSQLRSGATSDDPGTKDFEKNQKCNLIIWGKWLNLYNQPIQLNMKCSGTNHNQAQDMDDSPLKQCITDMISQDKFCLFTTEDGSLYATGENLKGMLGLGSSVVSTGGKACRVFLDPTSTSEPRIIDFKVGTNHALALTDDGRVFGWGQNVYGQVGYQQADSSQSKADNREQLWTPVQVYPTLQMIQQDAEYFDVATQIEAFEDSSFLITNNGSLYSWGKNDHGFLGRESKFDFKSMSKDQQQESQKKLAFSNFVPCKVRKLEQFCIKRISIKQGKIMCFFSQQGRAPPGARDYDSDNTSSSQEDDDSFSQTESKHRNGSQATNSHLRSQSYKDSEIDSEEGKDVVPDDLINRKIGGAGGKKKNLFDRISLSSSKVSSSKRSSSSADSSSVSSSNYTSSNTSQGGVPVKRTKEDREIQRRYELIKETLRNAIGVKDELQKFDRQLADCMRPLTDLDGSRNLYQQVIDQFANGTFSPQNCDQLRLAIDKVQIQLKRNVEHLNIIEQKIKSDIKELLEVRYQELKRSSSSNKVSLEDEAMFKECNAFMDLLCDSLTLKKINLVGCKMKIYQERMKEINFLALLTKIREKQEENQSVGDEDDEEKSNMVIDFDNETRDRFYQQCKILCKKTQKSLIKNTEFYLQMHLGSSVTSSLALSALTNSVYISCDLWNGLGTLTLNADKMQDELRQSQVGIDEVRNLNRLFTQIKETDFDRQYKEFQERGQRDYPSAKEWFDRTMEFCNSEIAKTLDELKIQKENLSRLDKNSDVNEILNLFAYQIEDAGSIRQLLNKMQQALFDISQNKVPKDFMNTNGGGQQRVMISTPSGSQSVSSSGSKKNRQPGEQDETPKQSQGGLMGLFKK